MSGPPPEYYWPPVLVPEVPDDLSPPSHERIVEELGILVEDQEPPTDLLFHYTSLQALYGMIETQAVWCTEVRHLNDRREQDEFRHLMRKFIVEEMLGGPMGPHVTARNAGAYRQAVDEFRRRLEQFTCQQLNIPKFVFSLTTEHDRLSQWRGYARSDGVAIGFCWKTLRQIAEKHRYIFARCGYTEFDVQRVQQHAYGNPAEFKQEGYDLPNRMLQRIRSLPVNVWQSSPDVWAGYLQRFACLAPIAKDYGFHEEREWRIFAVEGVSSLGALVYHPRRDQLIRRAVLGIGTAGQYATPIRQVVLSPALSADERTVARIIENLDQHASRVGHHGCTADPEHADGKATIRLSTIPLRD